MQTDERSNSKPARWGLWILVALHAILLLAMLTDYLTDNGQGYHVSLGGSVASLGPFLGQSELGAGREAELAGSDAAFFDWDAGAGAGRGGGGLRPRVLDSGDSVVGCGGVYGGVQDALLDLAVDPHVIDNQ